MVFVWLALAIGVALLSGLIEIVTHEELEVHDEALGIKEYYLEEPVVKKKTVKRKAKHRART